MTLLRALVAFLTAASAFFRIVYPVAVGRKIKREIEQYEDEIYRLGDSGSADDKLRIETLAKRKDRASEQLRALRSAYGDADPRS